MRQGNHPPEGSLALQSIVRACSQEARRLNALPAVEFSRAVAGLLWDFGVPEEVTASSGLLLGAFRGSLNAVSALATLAHKTGDAVLTRMASEAVDAVAARSVSDRSPLGINAHPAGQA